MPTVNISLDQELYTKLKRKVPSRGVSKFVALAVSKKFAEEDAALEAAYKEAALDEDRLREIAEWEQIGVIFHE